MSYIYTLEKTKTPAQRHTCPQCGKRREFVRYISTDGNNEYLADHVGRCNREVKCGYHYKPGQYFEDNPQLKTGEQATEYQRRPLPPPPPKVNIPGDVMQSTLNRSPEKNRFINYLHTLFDPAIVNSLICRYHIGTANSAAYWNKPGSNESTVFWFINKRGGIRYGQLKLFDATGHTDSYTDTFKDNELSKCTTGIHYTLKAGFKQIAKPLPQWLTEYPKQDKLSDCFFGEHLLSDTKTAALPVAIVEAPKGAIICSVFFPQYVWIAAGSLSTLTAERCEVLRGRNVVLFPDLGEILNKEKDIVKAGWEQDRGQAYNMWKQKAQELAHVANFTVSHILETRATTETRAAGLDICDYVTSAEVRRELCEAFKADIMRLPDDHPNTHKSVWVEYICKGLKREDIRQAYNELIEDGKLTPAAEWAITPHHYSTSDIIKLQSQEIKAAA